MRRVPISSVQPGMKVGHVVYNSLGQILLNRGVALTQAYINSLIQFGIPALYITDDFLPDVRVEDVIDDHTRVKAIKQVKTILTRTSVSQTILEDEAAVLQKTVCEMLDQLLNSPSVMVNLVDIRNLDDYLFGHSVNVCVLSLLTGASLGMEKASLINLGMGAILHDIGKMLIPHHILNKPGKVTEEEFRQLKKHPEYSYEILARGGFVKKSSAIIALQHHERYNGSGYPRGLIGEDIQISSQIVGIADVYDAMTADRVYRRANLPNDVYEMLAACGDYLFDYDILKAFLGNVAAYPNGSVVGLNSNEIGVVAETSRGFPLYPKLKVIFNQEGYCKESYLLDMTKDINLCITKLYKFGEVEKLKSKVSEDGANHTLTKEDEW